MNTAALRNHLLLAFVLLYFASVFRGVLFSTDGVFERDGFYHARYAQMLTERGLSRQFPWMQFTDWKENFADKDFLYHLILAPFCRDAAEPLPGAKWATLLLGMAAYLAFYIALVRLNVRWPIFWTVLLIVGSGIFLNRMLMVRSHVFSVLLMILSSWAIIRDKVWLCLVLGFVYAWSYSFPLAMVITAIAACAGRFALGERTLRTWQTAAAATGGVALGLVIHPYSPNTLTLVWTLVKIATSRAAGIPLELGSEFRPMLSSNAFSSGHALVAGLFSMLIEIPGPLLALSAAVMLAIFLKAGRLKDRRLSSESAAALGAALAWFAAIFVFSRLVEYLAPLATLAAALVCRDALAPENELPPRTQLTRYLATALASLMVLSGLYFLALQEVSELGYSTLPHGVAQMYINEAQWKSGRFFSDAKTGGAAEWMHAHLPADSTVLNFHWDDFTELYYDAPQFHYIVGLDPTLMRVPYPEQSATLEAMRTQQIPLDFAKLHQLFGADYMIMRSTRAATFPDLKNGVLRPVYADDGAVIYKLQGPEVRGQGSE